MVLMMVKFACIFAWLQVLVSYQSPVMVEGSEPVEGRECYVSSEGVTYSRVYLTTRAHGCLRTTEEIVPSETTRCGCANYAQTNGKNTFSFHDDVCTVYTAGVTNMGGGDVNVYSADEPLTEETLPEPKPFALLNPVRLTSSLERQTAVFVEYDACNAVDHYKISTAVPGGRRNDTVPYDQSEIVLTGPSVCIDVVAIIKAYAEDGTQMGEETSVLFAVWYGDINGMLRPWNGNTACALQVKSSIFGTFDENLAACAAVKGEVYGRSSKDEAEDFMDTLKFPGWLNLQLQPDDTTWMWGDGTIMDNNSERWADNEPANDPSKRCVYYGPPREPKALATAACDDPAKAEIQCVRYYEEEDE